MADQADQTGAGKTQSAEQAEKGPSEQQQAEQEYAEQERKPESPGRARGTGTDA